jgi:tetratricopeptide (TPR) repeat protein
MSHEHTDPQRWAAVEEATELLLDKQHDKALEELKRAILDDPGNPYAYYYTGVAMDELGQLEAARDAFRAAVRVAPEYLAARVGLAHALRKTGDLAGAIREARDTLRRFPDDGDSHFALGLALAARGDRDGARQHLEAFLRSNPEIESQLEARAMLERLGQGSSDFGID